MEAIWKTVLMFGILSLIGAAGLSVLSANVEVAAAEHYLVNTAMVIQESNYNSRMIESCCSDAEDKGYRLTVTRYGSPGANRGVAIQLEYPYRLPGMGIDTWKKKKLVI